MVSIPSIGNWLLQASTGYRDWHIWHILTYLTYLDISDILTYLFKLYNRVRHLSIFSSLLISCLPISALKAIIHTLFSDNKRNSWLGHLKKIPLFLSFPHSLWQIKRTLERNSFIHLLIWSGSQLIKKSVRKARTVGIDLDQIWNKVLKTTYIPPLLFMLATTF